MAAGKAIRVPTTRSLDFRLTWDRTGQREIPVEVDLGCFYWASDATRGAVQPVGIPVSENESDRAVLASGEPLLHLTEDDVEGSVGSQAVTVERPGAVAFLVIYASIYAGAPDFRGIDARVTARSGDRRLRAVTLSSPAPGLEWCAVLVAGLEGRRFHVAREERYFRSAYHADRHYGLGLRWSMGRKR